MKIFFKKYQFAHSPEGVLFKASEKKKSNGFYFYSPWTSLGQKSIEHLLEDLKMNSFHFVRSFLFKDMYIYRRYLSSKLPSFYNHSFFKDDLIHCSEKYLKLKLTGRFDSDREKIIKLNSNFESLRLDLNFNYSEDEFSVLIDFLQAEQVKIDYIEDPIPWKEESYKKFLDHKFNIVLDQPYNSSKKIIKGLPVIFKPVLHSYFGDRLKEQIFSSNMNGPLSDWHTYCELLHFGNLSLHHGICTNQFDSESSIFSFKKSVNVEKEIVQSIYEKLESLDGWNSL